MENKKIKNFFKFKLLGLVLFTSFGTAFAADFFSGNIANQSATGVGSSSSQVSISNSNDVGYWNAGNNSTVIGNYFKGYYYDSVFGFFQLDWSTKDNENVRIVGSSSACTTGYGYKLGGYAYSKDFGFIDFDYSNNIFVYYCVDDGKLHGYAYNENIGFQNFEGIGFEIIPGIGTTTQNTSTGIFVNDNTKINMPNFWDGNINSSIGGDMIQLEDDKESIFYIIK